jgi:uncharacterized protein YbaR (Trm112 family)
VTHRVVEMFYCPVCKSQEIYAVAGGYIGQVFLCKDCGYRGSLVLEIDEDPAVGTTERKKKDEA